MDPLQATLAKSSRELLSIFVRIYAFVYFIIALSHVLLLPDHLALPLSVLAGTSVLIGIALHLRIQSEAVLSRSELVMVGLVLLMGVNSMAHLYLAEDIRQTTNVIFVMAVAGYVLPGYRAFYVVIAVIVAAWLSLVLFGDVEDGELLHFGFEILLGVMFSVFLHTLRRNHFSQLSDLESTVEKLDVSQRQVSIGESLRQHLMDTVPAGIIVRDMDTRILFANSVARDLLGIGPEMAGMAFADNNL